MSRWLVRLLLVVLVTGLAWVIASKFAAKPDQTLKAWNEYHGQSGPYRAVICETLRGRNWDRTACIEAAGEDAWKHNPPVPYSVRLQGYSHDGAFDKVDIRLRFDDGYNTIRFIPGGWKWEPCPADKDKVKPYTAQEVEEAVGKLKAAVAAVYKPEHRIKRPVK